MCKVPDVILIMYYIPVDNNNQILLQALTKGQHRGGIMHASLSHNSFSAPPLLTHASSGL